MPEWRAQFQFLVTGGKTCLFFLFWWADEESAAPHRREEGADFFPPICTPLTVQTILLKKKKSFQWDRLSFKLGFQWLLPQMLKDILRKLFFFFSQTGFIEDTQLCGLVAVRSQLVCLLTGLCVAGKGRCLLPNVGLADSIKKISKGSL